MPHWQRQRELEADDSDRLELSLKQDLNVHLKFTLKPFDSTRRGTVTIASGSSTAEPQAVPLYKLADPVADWRCFRTVAAKGGGRHKYCSAPGASVFPARRDTDHRQVGAGGSLIMMLRLWPLICDFDLKFVESEFDTARCSSASGTARGKGGVSASESGCSVTRTAYGSGSLWPP